MNALHPSNPYYSRVWNAHLNAQSQTILSPYEPRQKNQRSMSLESAPPTDSLTSTDPPPNPRKSVTYRTHSIGGPFGTSVYFERQMDLSPPNDDEIIIATVRVTNSFRKASIEGCAELPDRPPARGFLRRLSSRISGPVDNDRYTAIKMPRKDYKAYFAKDRDGNYAGTEPEREWSQEQLDQAFGEYQDMPLRSIPGGSEYGEGDAARIGSGQEGGDGEAVARMREWSDWKEAPRRRDSYNWRLG